MTAAGAPSGASGATGDNRLVVVGSSNMDFVSTVARFPEPGQTVLGTGFAVTPGGKGANQAVAAARAGARVSFVGAVGNDAFGESLREVLERDGIDTTGLREAVGPSGVAVITVDAAGENTIVVASNANAAVTALTEADRAAIAAADLLMCQLELPMPVVVEAATWAHAHDTVAMLNCSPVTSLPEDLVAAVDVLVLNAGEADAVGTAVTDRVTHVVTTLGAEGARYRGPAGTTTVPAIAVDVVDTTGAGDAFAGALAAFWSEGPDRALRAACAAGALTATRPGASAVMPDRASIEALAHL